MSRNIKLTFLFLILALMITPFTNCSSHQDSSLFNQTSTLSCLDTGEMDGSAECFDSNIENLELSSTTTELKIRDQQISFNMGGDCNEGGFPRNRIDWEVRDNDRKVVASSTGNALPVCLNPENVTINTDQSTSCINGRFMNRIQLIEANRGLRMAGAGSNRQSFELILCIAGIDENEKMHLGQSFLYINLSPL